MTSFRFRTLAELCDLRIASVNPRSNPNDEFWYVDISAVDNNTKRITAPQRIRGEQASVRARQLICTDDILVATTRPNLNAIAKVPPEYDGEVCSSGFCVLRPNEELDPDYLFSFVQSAAFINPLDDLTKGALYPAVTDKQVLNQVIRWIPVEEQRVISNGLNNQLAEVETGRQAAILQLQDAAVLKSRALETIFACIPNRGTIGSVAKVQSGYAFKSDTFKTSGVRLLRNTNILPGKVYWDDQVFLSVDDSRTFQSYQLNDGDVLISLDRPIISSGIKVARVGAVDLPALLVQRVGRFLIDQDQLDADYLYAYLQTQMFISAITGHDQSLGVPHISPTQVENVEIPLPDVATQKKLSKQLNEIAREWQVIRSAIQEQLTDLTTLPNAILAQAFES